MNYNSEEINIGSRKIGIGEPVYIIAEIGINHNGDINLAIQMIEAAAESGADAVKFQVYKTERFISRSSSYFDILKKCELKDDDVMILAKKAADNKIAFLATPFDEESVDLLDAAGVFAFKIASGDITHIPLIQHIAKYDKPVIISTGAATLVEVDDAVRCLLEKKNLPIALLHCVSHYPTKPNETNLRVLKTLHARYHVPIGYSDHTIGTLIPTVAVACGANIIEKHFTLDKEMEGPDHKSSCDPIDFKKMTQDIRTVEQSLGSKEKRPVETEDTRLAMRRSLTASIDIPKGTVFNKEVIEIKRPATGIHPKDIEKVIGHNALVDIQKDEAIQWDMV